MKGDGRHDRNDIGSRLDGKQSERKEEEGRGQGKTEIHIKTFTYLLGVSMRA